MILWTGAGFSHYSQLARDTPASLRTLAHTSSRCPARVAPERYPGTLLAYAHSSPSHLAIGSLRAGEPRTPWTAPVPTPGLHIPPGLHPLQLQLFLQGSPGKECFRTSSPCTLQLQLFHQGSHSTECLGTLGPFPIQLQPSHQDNLGAICPRTLPAIPLQLPLDSQNH